MKAFLGHSQQVFGFARIARSRRAGATTRSVALAGSTHRGQIAGWNRSIFLTSMLILYNSNAVVFLVKCVKSCNSDKDIYAARSPQYKCSPAGTEAEFMLGMLLAW